jgi:hypothetical protein
MAVKGLRYEISAVPIIMIAENGDNWLACQLLKNLRAWLGVACAPESVALKKRVRDEIAGKNGEVRFERQSQSNRAFDLLSPYVWAEVHVGHVDNAKSVEGLRETRQADVDVLGDEPVRLDDEAIYAGGRA